MCDCVWGRDRESEGKCITLNTPVFFLFSFNFISFLPPSGKKKSEAKYMDVCKKVTPCCHPHPRDARK